MKTIGLLGGMSWESTLNYYKAINQGIKQALGGLHSSKLCLYSVDFDEIEKLQNLGQWDQTVKILSQAAQSVEAGGADFLLICTNTMHKVADEIQSGISIPIVHIADATAKQLQADGIKRVGLLGTQFTMEQPFYKQRLIDNFGVDVIVPNAEDQSIVHQVIYSELCLGKIEEKSRNQYLRIIDKLHQEGAEAVILGCTEIALLVEQRHTTISLYDTTEIHAAEAVRMVLSE
ncbi:aspartate/glutamate racemase family protein [Vibrio gangliei]|uniref:aspartate/glutamate racemase family protein n=1 Tax=Vibrio gangliei TaxID=2077090 RepID=UPI000D017899|nr:aspartate/glutamate racemase family protein [Vibrio gangliei]